jgi:hypothetical protein
VERLDDILTAGRGCFRKGHWERILRESGDRHDMSSREDTASAGVAWNTVKHESQTAARAGSLCFIPRRLGGSVAAERSVGPAVDERACTPHDALT